MNKRISELQAAAAAKKSSPRQEPSTATSSSTPLPTFGLPTETARASDFWKDDPWKDLEVDDHQVGAPDPSGRRAQAATPLLPGRPRQSPLTSPPRSHSEPPARTTVPVSSSAVHSDLPDHPAAEYVLSSPIWMEGMKECPHAKCLPYHNQHGSGWRCEDCTTKWHRSNAGDQKTTSGPSRYRRPGYRTGAK